MGDGRVNLFAERRAKALRKLDLRGGSTDKDAEKGSMWHNAVPGHAHELYEGVQKERSKSPQAARDCPRVGGRVGLRSSSKRPPG